MKLLFKKIARSNLGIFLSFVWGFERVEEVSGGLIEWMGELGEVVLLQKSLMVPEIPLTVWALTLFVIVFTFAIAIFKDIPDIDGDRRYNINTFTIRLGAFAVFNLARWVLTVCYLGMVMVGVVWLGSVNLFFLVISFKRSMPSLSVLSNLISIIAKSGSFLFISKTA